MTGTTLDLAMRMVSLGAFPFRLRPGMKQPNGRGWQLSEALTPTEVAAHADGGGNIGLHLGKSAMIAFDAEDRLATAAVMEAGFVPTVIPAKGQYEGVLKPGLDDPESGKENRKVGGSHVWLRVPAGIDSSSLSSDHSMQLTLPNGGLIDVLCGPKYVVAPPSALDLAYGTRYAASQGGPLDLALGVEAPDLVDAPMWLFDLSVPCPPGLAPLHGCLIPRVREHAEQSARSAELSAQIDEVPWDQWLAGEHRLTPTGEVDGCGCDTYYWQGSTNKKSCTLHDGCEQGNGVHVWSGTMIGHLGLAQHHLSRLDLAVALRGESRRAVAAAHGIQLGGEREELRALRPSDYEWIAKQAEEHGNTARAAMYREAAAAMAAKMPTPEARGETFISEPMVGMEGMATVTPLFPDGVVAPQFRPTSAPAGARAAAPPIFNAGGTAPPTAGATALQPEPAPDAHSAPQPDPAPAQPVPPPADAPQSAQASSILDDGKDDNDEDDDEPAVELDLELRRYEGTPPREKQLMQYPLPETPAHVKPVEGATTEWRDVFPPIANASTHALVPFEWIFSATPGMSQVAAAADARGLLRWGMLGALLPRVAAKIPATVRLVPASGSLPEDVSAETAAGTSINVYSILVGGSGSGKTDTMSAATALIPGVRTLPPGTGEGVLKEFPPADAGDDSDQDNNGAPAIGTLEPIDPSVILESDEIDVFVGEMMRQGSKTTGWYRSMWMGNEVGNTAVDNDRRSLIAAHSYRFGILLGAQPDAVAVMFNESGRGTPQRFMWLSAQQSVPRGTYPERLQVAEVHWFGDGPSMIPSSVQRPPVWIYPPKAAKDAMKRARWEAATSDALASPRIADRAEAIANRHAVLQQLKISVLIAALDGLTQPQDTHWHVAGAIMEVRRRAIHQLVAEADRVKAEGEHVRGTYAGIAHAAANDARDAARKANVVRCAKTIISALIRDAEKGRGPRTPAQAKKALSSTARAGGGLSDRQLYGDEAFAMVRRDPVVADLTTHVKFAGTAVV